jgi:hypothetical protein
MTQSNTNALENINYLGANDLVFNNDHTEGIQSGGFSVSSMIMKAGMSPIMTVNQTMTSSQKTGGGPNEKVADLFRDLVIPNWALSYNSRILETKKSNPHHDEDDEDSEHDDDVIQDDLHDKLLGLVKQHDNDLQKKNKQKRATRKTSKASKQKNTKKRKL